MTLHLITLIVGFNAYKWVDNPIECIEKENAFIVTDENDEAILRLIPELIPKSKIGVILASQHTSIRQISLSIYTQGKDLTEAKDKLITEITRLSEAYNVGFAQQKIVLANIIH